MIGHLELARHIMSENIKMRPVQAQMRNQFGFGMSPIGEIATPDHHRDK